MLNVNELRNGVVFKEGNQTFQVILYEHIKTGRGSGNIKLKVRNLKTGSVTEKSFITGARVDEAETLKKKTQFLYSDGDNYYFMDPVTFEQFPLNKSIIGSEAKFLKDGVEVTLLVGEGGALALELPMAIIYKISETGPSEKGNTVANVYKDAILDNGLALKVPMFLGVGEKIKVDTRTGQYLERVR